MADGLMPGVPFRPVTNRSSGGMRRPILGQVEHHTVGTLESAESLFNQPSSKASAHFGVDYDGSIVQWVSINDRAWHAARSGEGANYQWVGIENRSPSPGEVGEEGDLYPPLTPEQVVGNGHILAWLHATEDVPMQVTNNPGIGGVAYHNMVPSWGQTGCPGDAIVGQRQAIVDAATGTTDAEVPTKGPTDMRLVPYGATWLQFGVDTAGDLIQSTYDANLNLVAGAQDVKVLGGNRPSSDVAVEVLPDQRILVGTESTEGKNRAINYRPGDGWYDARGTKLP